ncbi:RNA-directed DNA polymerase, eukaryota [Tanacetum coccineum]
MGMEVSKSQPALVLGDECMVTKEISNALFRRVKEFASLANLKLAMTNEGFVDLTIKYMGELWVMLEFKSEESKSKFNDNISVASWFSQIIEASLDFTVEGRIAWVEVEGIPFKLWSGNTFSRIANKWGKLLDVDDQEDSCFHSKQLCIHTKSGENSVGEEIPETIFAEDGTVKSRAEGDFKDKNVDMSEDPFNIYSLLNKNKCTNGNVNNSGSSLKYPPGFTPSVGIDEKDVSVVDGTTRNDGTTRVKNKEEYTHAFSDCRDKCNSNENGVESKISGHFKKSKMPRTGGSIIGLLDEVVRVGQTMGYRMEGVISNMTEIIASQGVEEETKMVENGCYCVVSCGWGNLAFDHVHSDAVGNSGGILCVWDPYAFCKTSATVSDYFVITRGHWRLTRQEMMVIAIYAPQDNREKQSLWEYLQQVISNWKGEVIIMGDFNEIFGMEDSPCVGNNAMSILMGKLRYLKNHIRKWNKTNLAGRNNSKAQIKRELEAIDLIIDKGQGNEDVIRSRADIMNQLHNCNKLDSMEAAQKAKVKWAVEGDENSGFFHGIINKKCNIRSIVGSDVSNDEIKKAVWECGTDKAPGPDGFTFGFFRHFWHLVEKEVQDAVRWISRKLMTRFGGIFLTTSFVNSVLGINGVNGYNVVSIRLEDLIIINGSPTDEFQFGKGLKQGDPLSPFLFILIMETLHLSFQRVVDAGMFHGLKLGGTLNLSHMFYADDAVFVGEWSENNIATLVHVLDCFHKVSGLKINMNKSKIIGTHVDHDKVSRAANKLGCLILKAPFLYLGSYVGGNMNRLKSWDDIINRVRRRLSNWKMKMLSIGGRLTLVKSVLGSMPIFHMSLFKVPSGILRTLESIRSQFFNGIDGSKNKVSWVQWSKVLAPKVNGGLGVSSLFALNRGLIFKWVWRFVSHDNSLWARVIKAVHGEDGNIGVNSKNGSNSAWLNIVREINVLSKKGERLKDRFPRAYALDSCKEITVGSKLVQPTITYSFRRPPRGGVEQMQTDELTTLMQNVSLTPMQDR